MRFGAVPHCVPSIRAPIMCSAIEYPLDFTENRDRERNWSDRILRNARILGVRGLPKVVFLYVELFNFQIQRRPRNSELDCRTAWPSDFSVAFSESCFDELLLIAQHVLCQRT